MKESEKESKQVTRVSPRDRATPHNLRKCATSDTRQRIKKEWKTSERELNAAKISGLGLRLGG